MLEEQVTEETQPYLDWEEDIIIYGNMEYHNKEPEEEDNQDRSKVDDE